MLNKNGRSPLRMQRTYLSMAYKRDFLFKRFFKIKDFAIILFWSCILTFWLLLLLCSWEMCYINPHYYFLQRVRESVKKKYGTVSNRRLFVFRLLGDIYSLGAKWPVIVTCYEERIFSIGHQKCSMWRRQNFNDHIYLVSCGTMWAVQWKKNRLR